MSCSEAFNCSDLIIIGAIISKTSITLWNDTSSARNFYDQLTTNKSYYKDYDTYKKLLFSDTIYHYSIQLVKNYKGEINNNIIVETSSGNCGYPFYIGQTYLIYGRLAYNKLSNVFWADKCNRTQVYSPDSDDIKYLDGGK